jgi:hypothetical protein
MQRPLTIVQHSADALVSKGSPLVVIFRFRWPRRAKHSACCLECPPSSGVTSWGAATDPMAILERQALAVGKRRSLVQ